jgi:hypothetical protein
MMAFPPLKRFQQSRARGKASFVDVRPFLITDTPATKLIQQAKVRFTTRRHRPSPLVHCHPQRFVWEQSDDVADTLTLPNCLQS